jgi:hypothetical protein
MDVSFGDAPGKHALVSWEDNERQGNFFRGLRRNLIILNAFSCERVRTGANCGVSAARNGGWSDCQLNR